MLPRINRLCHWCRTLQSWERNITNICIQSTGGFPIKLLPQTTGLDGGEDPNGSLLDKHFVSSAIDWEIVFLLVQVFGHSWLQTLHNLESQFTMIGNTYLNGKDGSLGSMWHADAVLISGGLNMTASTTGFVLRVQLESSFRPDRTLLLRSL